MDGFSSVEEVKEWYENSLKVLARMSLLQNGSSNGLDEEDLLESLYRAKIIALQDLGSKERTTHSEELQRLKSIDIQPFLRYDEFSRGYELVKNGLGIALGKVVSRNGLDSVLSDPVLQRGAEALNNLELKAQKALLGVRHRKFYPKDDEKKLKEIALMYSESSGEGEPDYSLTP